MRIPSVNLMAIQVGGMTTDECQSLLACQSRGEFPQNHIFVYQVLNLLDRNPYLITRLGAYFASSNLKIVNKFRDALESDPILFLADDPRYPSRTLSDLCLSAIEEVKRDPLSFSLLKLLATGADFRSAPEFPLSFFLQRAMGKADEPGPMWNELTRRALCVLEQQHLIYDAEISQLVACIIRSQMSHAELISLIESVVDTCLEYATRYIRKYGVGEFYPRWKYRSRGSMLFASLYFIMTALQVVPASNPGRPWFSAVRPTEALSLILQAAVERCIQKHNISGAELKIALDAAAKESSVALNDNGS